METHFKIHSSYTFPPTNNDIPTLQSPTLRKKQGVHYNNHINLKNKHCIDYQALNIAFGINFSQFTLNRKTIKSSP